MAVCKPRPPPPPLPDDLALLAEGARLALGEASPLDWTHGNENMGVKVFSVAVPVRSMNCPIRDKALAGEVLVHEVADEKNLLRGRQFVRKGDFKAAGELRVIGSGAVTFDKLKSVPKFGPDRRPRRRVFRGPDFRVKNASLAAVVVNAPRPFVGEGIAGAIGRCGNDAADVRASLEIMMQVKNRHVFPCRRQGLHIENVQTCLSCLLTNMLRLEKRHKIQLRNC